MALLEVRNIKELGTINWGPKHRDIGGNSFVDSFVGKSKFYSNTVNIAVGAVNTKGKEEGEEGEENFPKVGDC